MAKKLSSGVALVLVVLIMGLFLSSASVTTIEREIWVSPEKSSFFEFSVEKTGTIYAEARLEEKVEEPFLILEFLSTGEIKERVWGKSGELLTLRYNVSERNLAGGTKWKISVESGAGEGGGYIKIDYPPSDMTPPTAIISAIPTEINEGESVSFSAEASSDQDGYIVSYDWDFGDGYTDAGINVEHVYSHSGHYTATLTVTDNDGLSDSNRVEITANPLASNTPPTAYIDISPNPATDGEEVTFEGYGEDEDGEVVECRWTFPDGRTFLDSGSSSWFTLESEDVHAGWYSFAVRDDDGAWSEEARVELELEPPPTIPWTWILAATVLVIAAPLIIRMAIRKPSQLQINIETGGGIESMHEPKLQQYTINVEVRGGIERL